MLSTDESTQTPDLIALLAADVYHLAGAFRDSGDQIASKVGQTQARWQLLSVVSEGPQTVAQIARRLGLARQSVQRTANQLVRLRLARYLENPDHKRSSLMQITEGGKRVLAQITRESEESKLELSRHFKRSDLTTALHVVRKLREMLEARAGEERSGRDNE